MKCLSVAQPCLVTAGHRLKINTVNILFLADEKFNIFKYINQFSDPIVYCLLLLSKHRIEKNRFSILHPH